MKKLIFVLLIFVISCAAQTVPAWLKWSYTYENTAGQPIDTTDITFQVFFANDSTAVYSFYSETPDTFAYLLATDTLYSDQDWWFYLKARQLSKEMYSNHSDTVSGYFPILKPDVPYNLKCIETELK